MLAEDAHLVSTAASRRSGQPPRDVEYRIRRADTGEIRWIARKGEIECDAPGRPLRFPGHRRDITEARAVLDALAESEQRYRALFEAVDDGFCIIEFIDGPDGPLSDYVHIVANSGYRRHTGIADILGKRLREIAPTEAEGWLDLYGGVLRNERRSGSSAPSSPWDGISRCRRPVEPASRRQVSVLFRDITERKRAEAALRESEEQFRILAQAIPHHVWSSRADGFATWHNAQTYAYTGLAAGASTASLRGRGWCTRTTAEAPPRPGPTPWRPGWCTSARSASAGRTGSTAGSSSAPSPCATRTARSSAGSAPASTSTRASAAPSPWSASSPSAPPTATPSGCSRAT